MIDRRSKRDLALLLIPMLGVAVLEMVSLGMIIPVIQVVLFGSEAGGAYADILDRIVPAGGSDADRRLAVSIAFCALFAIKSLLLFGMIFLINRTVYRKVTKFTADMFSLYMRRPLRFHLERNNAELLRNLTSGASLTFEAVRHVLMIALESFLMGAAILFLFLVEPMVTLLMAGVLGVVAIMLYKVAAPIFRHWGTQQQALEGTMIKWIVQSFSSIRDVKLFGSYSFLDARFRSVVGQRARYQTFSVSSLHVPRLILETIVVVGFMMLIGVMVNAGSSREQIVATLGVFGMAAIRILPSLNRILSSGAELRQRSAYIDTLYDDWRDGLADGEADAPPNGTSPIAFEREISIGGVDFSYPEANRPALHSIDLKIRKGESVGFVGPSGSGKSTLMDVVLGLIEPERGGVSSDGTDIAADRPGWRMRIGFVPQQIYLLDDTVRRNIAFGVPDEEIDETRIASAISMSHLEEVVSALPKGADTEIGEQGTRLSGGQCQRIAIARALYHDPDILVFDEATSALDTVSEAEITRAIDSLAGSRTVLIIAHRLGTVKSCDRIVFIHDGRIADQGSFDELASRNPNFAELAAIEPETAA